MRNIRTPRICLSLMVLPLLALVACGDNAGTRTAATSPSVSTGRYTVQGSSSSSVTIVEPSANGGSEVTLWTVKADASQLTKLTTTQASGTASSSTGRTGGTVAGKVFTLGTDTVQSVSGGSFESQASGSQVLLTLQNIVSENLSLTRSDPMATELTLAQAQGSWQADLGDVVVDWTLSGSTISGSSTSGCTYSGTLSTVPGVSLYRVSFTETCGSTTLSLAGIATLGSNADRFNVAATTTDEAKAAVFFFTKSTT